MKRCLLLLFLCLLVPASASAQGWLHWPTQRSVAATHSLTQGFYGDYLNYCGRRDGCGTHNGYDYIVPSGTALFAAAPGVVDAVFTTNTRSTDYGNAGLWVRLRHEPAMVPGLTRTYFTAYLHMSRIDVAVGATVTTTTRIGLSGNTGNVGAHLHMLVSTGRDFCSAPVDPGCPTPAYVSGSVIPSAFVDAPGCQSRCAGVPILWVQPAAYGGEPYVTRSTCGSLDYRGRCDGEVLHWCENGSAMTANCADRNAVCAFQDPMVGYNCLRCDPAMMRPLLPAPRCEGGRWLRCEGTNARSTQCGAMNQLCTVDGCRPPPPPPMPDVVIPEDATTMDVNIDVAPFDATTTSDVFDAQIAVDAPRDGFSNDRGRNDVVGGCSCHASTHTRFTRETCIGVLGLLAVASRKKQRRGRDRHRAH